MSLTDELLDGEDQEQTAPKGRKGRKEKKPQGKKGRAKTSRAKALLQAPEMESRDEILTPHNAKGTTLRERSRLAKVEWYAPTPQGAPTTTRQAEVLNTAVVAGPVELDAPLVGVDTLSDSFVTHDPFQAYSAGLISSPNVLLIGDVGSSKSSAAKLNYVLRPLLLRGRRVAVIDKKERDKEHAEGEYAELSRAFGSEPVRFTTGSDGVVMNLMDPKITGTIGGQKDQIRLLRTIAELTQDGKPLDQWESEALRAAYRGAMRTAEARGRVPVLTDVVDALGRADRDREYDELNSRSKDRLQEAGFGVKFLMNGLLEEYSGVFDGETSSEVQLSSKLTSFDVSQLPEDGPLISMVISMVNTWLLGAVRSQGAVRTNFVIDEGWHVMNGPVARLMRSNTKLARALGLAMVTAFHKIADIPEDSPAVALLQEAQTVHLMGQSRTQDVERCVRDFGLDEATGEIIQKLNPGYHVFKRGTEPELLVHQLRSELEKKLTNTDDAMAGVEGERA